MSNIIAINAGSSSLKFQLLNMPEEIVVAKGLFERIGLSGSFFTIESDHKKIKQEVELSDHGVAVKLLMEQLIQLGIIRSFDEIKGIGHRVVHGGEKFNDSVLITDEVLEGIKEVSQFAPLHNPANITGIEVFREILPQVPAVAVFDTAFHQTMPESSFLYSVPYDYYKDYGIRKYGFHGTSHKYVSERAAKLLGRPIEQLRILSCHLGNGASITAIEGGRSLATSMGFTPLAGVTMGTRSGDIDPALIPYIMEQTGKNVDEVLDTLNKRSGLLGVSGFSSDLRDLEKEAKTGNKRAILALDVFTSRIHEYIGSYAAKMGGVDALVFTAGIGENSELIRARVLHGLEFMGILWDPDLNHIRGREVFINYPHSPVKVLIIPTNEEVMIARDTMRLANL